MSYAELLHSVAKHGRLGRYLKSAIEGVMKTARHVGYDLGETYEMGDSPLVTLTALQSSFQRDVSPSSYTLVPRSSIADGQYGPSCDTDHRRACTPRSTRGSRSPTSSRSSCHGRNTMTDRCANGLIEARWPGKRRNTAAEADHFGWLAPFASNDVPASGDHAKPNGLAINQTRTIGCPGREPVWRELPSERAQQNCWGAGS